MTGSGKPFPGNDRNVFILAKAAPVWGCLGNPLPETVFAVNRPEAIKTPRIPPISLFLGSSEGLKHAGDALVFPQTTAARHVSGSLGATRRDEGSTGGCSGPGKCLSLCCGFVTVAWKNFSGVFFPAGKKSRRKSPGEPTGRAGPAWGTGSSKMLHAIPCPCWFFGSTWEQNYNGKPSNKEWAVLHCLFILSGGA